MNVSFQNETVKEVWDEILPLLQNHHNEVSEYADIPVVPNEEFYLQMCATGKFIVFTVRLETSQLVGYAAFFVNHNSHHRDSPLQALQDLIYIMPEHRGHGVQFIKWCDEKLKDIGVEVVSHHVKTMHDWSKVLIAQGYAHTENVFSKRLGA